MIEQKNTHGAKEKLGQFFTDPLLAFKLVKDICIDNPSALIIEPSCGDGSFIAALLEAGITNHIVGVELDKKYANICSDKFKDNVSIVNQNWYDYSLTDKTDHIVFIGNPPYRTPAYSLSTHKEYLKQLMRRNGVNGIREECVFFILQIYEIIKQNHIDNAKVHLIVPETIIKNNSKFYVKFMSFLRDKFIFRAIKSIDEAWDKVSQSLIFLSLELKNDNNIQTKVNINGIDTELDDYLSNDEDLMSFKDIFKKTYLGSVPCESIFLSIEDEDVKHFRQRIVRLFDASDYSDKNLIEMLSYNGVPHLRVLKSNEQQVIADKLSIIRDYIISIKSKVDIAIFNEPPSYKPIQHRKSTRFYFRSPQLKKCGFVYELNPNPCPSFYFTGNPSASSTDYFGYCDYDINRNSSPGACRTIPVDGLEDNLTDGFKEYWKKNTDLPYQSVFDYIIFISKTTWYKDTKRKNKRMYFSIPKQFNTDFLII